MDKTAISALQENIKKRMSEKRYIHTVAVKEMAVKIGSYCLPERVFDLSCAALLHDVAKEVKDSDLVDIIKRSFSDYEKIIQYGKEVWHSFAAPYVIKRDFTLFAAPDILSAVQAHTVGAEDMSVFDEIIFISDYIEMGRTYPSCIAVREYLFKSLGAGDLEKNIAALHKSCILAIEYTAENLAQRGKKICPVSLLAKNALEAKIKY